MLKLSSFLKQGFAILSGFLILILFLSANANSSADSHQKRPDIIMIDIPYVEGSEKMPAARFFHDRHTDALKGKKDCSACHLSKNNDLIFKFKRIEDGSPETDMDIYHENCMGCHKELTNLDEPSGPLQGDCRSCHVTKLNVQSSRKPLNFDKYLHYRHESAKSIKPLKLSENTNCSACHHLYDEAQKKIFYKKGEEESCRYCHKEIKQNDVSSMRAASHHSCVNCHTAFLKLKQKTGPQNCTGCHDAEAQKKIDLENKKTIQSVPRLKRNQPDASLLASWMKESDITEEMLKKHVNPVVFNHEDHEQNTATCRECHHSSMKKCGECHTSKGIEKGNYITLEQAMHHQKSGISCMGCHQNAQAAKNCAGCHSLIPQKSFEEASCGVCHGVNLIGSAPFSTAEKEAIAKKSLNARSKGPAMVPDKLIPEHIQIGIMKDKYEAAEFPHRRIIHKLASGIKESKMAGVFHERQTTLCEACHHKTSATTFPPKCASCHGDKVNISQKGRPGLMAAYHGQCINCHQMMNIKKPAATDCNGCHKIKEQTKP